LAAFGLSAGVLATGPAHPVYPDTRQWVGLFNEERTTGIEPATLSLGSRPAMSSRAASYRPNAHPLLGFCASGGRETERCSGLVDGRCWQNAGTGERLLHGTTCLGYSATIRSCAHEGQWAGPGSRARPRGGEAASVRRRNAPADQESAAGSDDNGDGGRARTDAGVTPVEAV
jgi:hypothetical protein